MRQTLVTPILLATALLSGEAAAQLPPPRPITLNEALELAQVNAPQAIQARGQTRANQAAVRSSYGAFLPSLTFSMNANRQLPGESRTIVNERGETVTTTSDWGYNTNLGANLELFNGGRRFNEISQSKANVRAAEANETSQEFEVALTVKQEFFNVLAARESEVAARSQMEQAEQQFRSAVARVRAGSGTKSDSLRSQIQLNDARIAILEALNDLEVANAALTRAVGAPYAVTAQDSGGTEPPAVTVADQALLDMALHGPQVRQAEANLSAARAGRQIARSSYFPTISAGYSYGGSGRDPGGSLGFENYGGGLRLSLSYPLFNQFNRMEQSVRAQVAEENAQANLRNARLLAQENLTRYLGALRTAEQRVGAQELSVDAALEDLRVQQQRYALGASTLLDLLTSQSTLNDARRNLIRARYDQRVAKAQLEALVGQNL
jgi:outer membrane protein